MSRSRTNPEEWERTKRYLIRSLFEDLPVALSPIYEQQEPTSPSSPSNFRSECPLPDLIIEVEPKKPNPHDETDEFYDKLQKQMRRLYKKDFLGMHSSNSSSDIEPLDSLSATSNSFSSSLESDDGLREEDNTATNPQINQNVETEMRSLKNSSDTEIIPSEIIEADVEVHQVDEADEEYVPFRLPQTLQPIAQHFSTLRCDEEVDKDEDIEVETAVSENLAENTDASTTDSSSHNHAPFASPDKVRYEKHLTSLGTPLHQRQSESTSQEIEPELSMEMQTREFPGEVVVSEPDLEVAERTLSVERPVFLTPTPQRKRKLEETSLTPRERGQKRRCLSMSSNVLEVSTRNAATTSLSNREQDCSSFWSNLFVGEPTIYNICSCRNHVCS